MTIRGYRDKYAGISGLGIVYKTLSTVSYYVSIAGNDSNDGSVGNPYLTIQKAIDSVPEFLDSTVYIYVGAGTFAGYNIYKHALGDEQYIVVKGTTNAIVAEQTASSGTRETITKTGAGWTIDAYKGKFLKITGGTSWINDTTFPDASNCYPIVRNTADTIRIASHYTAFDNTTKFEIVEMATLISANRCVNVVATIPLIVYLVNQKYASTTSSGTCIFAKNSEVRIAGAHFLRTATYQVGYDHYYGISSIKGCYIEGTFTIGSRIQGKSNVRSTYVDESIQGLYSNGSESEMNASGLFIEKTARAMTAANGARIKIVSEVANSYFDENTYVFKGICSSFIEAIQPTVKTFATTNGTKVMIATHSTVCVNNLVTATNDYEFVSGVSIGAFVYNEDDGLKLGVNSREQTVSLADDAYIDLPAGKYGFGEVMAGDNEEWTQFRFTEAGVVTLLNGTVNVVNTDTDAKLCIFDNGTNVRIRNRLGATKIIKLVASY